MAHAQEEAAAMTMLADALVLNIGTLDQGLIDAMLISTQTANGKKIPVVLDVCGAGATGFRDEMCLRLLEYCTIDILKGNITEIGKIAGMNVQTKGVDAGHLDTDLAVLAKNLAKNRNCTVVITGAQDIITDGKQLFRVNNGHPMMATVVGTGCMAASILGTFAAVHSSQPAEACAAGLCCYGIAGEISARRAKGAGSFLTGLWDAAECLTADVVQRKKKISV
jgi:hydroxyethylthiazole kinase